MPPSTTPQQSNFAVNSAQNALVEGLQPALRSTLSSLNINLDYELARYRYAKQGEAPSGVPPTQFRSRRKSSLDLINVPPSSPAARPGAMPPPPPPNPRLQHIESPPGMPESTSEVAALRSALVPQSTTAQAGYMAASEAALQDFGSGSSFSEVAPTRASRRRTNQWLTPLGLGALLLLLVSSAGLGFLLVNPTAASNLFQQTPLARFFPSEEAEEDVTADGEVLEEEIAATALEEPSLTPLSPDLSQREFSDLELNNLSNLPSSSASLPEATALQNLPAGQAERLEGERASVASRETVGTPQRVNQIPTTTTPAPQPAAPVYQEPTPTLSVEQATQPAPPVESRTQPTPPAVSATPATSDTASPAPQSAYYVVTDYTGDPSLDDARTVVQDAYVRNFDMGARIQLGAFSNQEGAAELTETLRDQGIEAEIYEP
ncbi:MAG: hypothetical protein F6K00_21780 [Leptolyngbya sp. SIOISBB]|nr:hypothetical protein [Leptolyngbya sp. SIOISBB]